MRPYLKGVHRAPTVLCVLLAACVLDDTGLPARTDATSGAMIDESMALPDEAVTPPADASVGDVSVPGGDLAGDLAVPIEDAATLQDQTIPIIDLIPGPCNNGYLNSTDPNACPLSCDPAVTTVPDEGRYHVPSCTPVPYVHNPPACGPHWPSPAAWGWHQNIVPREEYVHNLEHGGIVLLYNCPWPDDGGQTVPDDGGIDEPAACEPDSGVVHVAVPDNCPVEIQQLVQLYQQGPVFNWFDFLFEVKIVVTPDPLLPTRFGAVAWDWSYTSNTLDTVALQCFINARYGRGPEFAP
jgi:hypothetical protein